ncbi:ATP-grasp domain-containing protein [Nakamurella flavida]|uniref:biotin carboxylase n=1 Tax=Nakamurella flavida TaxID=363630 RepID=A0A939C1I6_9ACTN|nr:carboxyl transferase domain-containing protein [Nakamurella flavida]MBM9477733.1 ATP-grasp domain-containing protein [Nakamurella flavida]MDP9779285.1 acetyl/propionyl-CoA carboxylase alpha subunit/acetyl-CoA carboxylase carboxyltransferase component [Nakamurella flavida]
MFSRIAVINRGEPAVRLIRAVRELNAEFGYGIRVIALHTAAERSALFVRAADESVVLRDKGSLGSPYLDHAELERAMRAARADAAWVGWGFVAEDPTFAELCERIGVTFIGPPAEAMRMLGDKVQAKIMAEANGVPVAAWSGGPVESPEQALEHAAAIGFPLILKARSGGGGRGIRIVRDPAELLPSLERVRIEAQHTFGDPVIFMERLVQGGRHIEVQVMADNHGTVWTPGVRDCSIQRRNQKLIEESSSPALTPEQSADLAARAAALVRAAGYRGAGTVEFLYQPQEKTFAFLEVNTRLQVEHPVTEETTGLDLVKLQIRVANGERLTGEVPPPFGHAIEARLNAEDADAGFAPSPGAVELLTLPSGPGIRVDTGIATGDVIPPDYDSMVAKIIAWGRTRSEAMARLRCALRETTVVLRGGTTTKSFLLDLLDRPEVVDGTADTAWLDRVGAVDETVLAPGADVALLAVAVNAYESAESQARDAFLRSARGGRPRAAQTVGRTVELGHLGNSYSLEVFEVSPGEFRVHVAEQMVPVTVERLSAHESRIVVAGRRHAVVSVTGEASSLVEVDGVSHRVSQDEGGILRSSAPAVVVAIPVTVGSDVQAGDTVAVLESMKMETPVRAPYAGRVREVLAGVNSQVDAGAPLVRLDRADDGVAASSRPTIIFTTGAQESQDDARARALAALTALRGLVTGYDVSAERARELSAEYETHRAAVPDDDRELVRAELSLLATFADLCELSRNRPARDEHDSDERVHSPREYFHTYLHSLDADREGLPGSFRQRLARVLAHYGVAEDETGDPLEEAVFRVFLALDRGADQIPVVTALLQRWLTVDAVLDEGVREEVGEVIERLIVATQLRYPVVGDLARNVRFRVFDRPLIEQARTEVYREIRAELGYLAANPHAADHLERMRTMENSPEPLIGVLAEQVLAGGVELAPMLEAMTRRYYSIRQLTNLRTRELAGRPAVVGDFELQGRTLHLVSTVADHPGLAGSLAAIAEVAATAADPTQVVTDIYLSWPDRPADSEAVSDELRAAVDTVPVLARGRRVTVSVVSGPDQGVEQFTFRPTGDTGVAEERIVRGLHPLIAQRLDLWRLKNFVGTRLPAADDVYLVHCVAPDNPSDERLVALAAVRDVTPLRDASGAVIAFPAAERMLAACLDSIRRVQATRGTRQRLDANRVILHVWPTIELPLRELIGFARGSVPLSVGAGLEEITVLAKLRERPDLPVRAVALSFREAPGRGLSVQVTDPPTEPIAPLDDYTQKVQRSAARGTVYPYEIVPLLTGEQGSFVEYDLTDGAFTPVDRPYGRNRAGIVAGLVSAPTERYPEGMERVALFGDPTKALGTVAVAECALIVAAVDLAAERGIPVEWFTLSSGATISMDSGTENMDAVARALRRLITFTQDGGEVNIVVAGINVGAQPYWNAEATMLPHTKGILVMTPDSAMVLTGKHSLDYSGGVSAEDNFGIGGYDRIMGPNGEAQYWAPTLRAAVDILFAHYEHAYLAPGERFPRPAVTTDPRERDVREYPHALADSDFTTVGDIFSVEKNRERKKPFDIRTVIESIVDQDHPTLERWAGMAEADTGVVVDAHLGGHPVEVIGIESRPIPRRGALPADGPDLFTSGTLFPRSSKKVARAINAVSGNRPLVVLANLSGFDGSPESLRNLQLEYGAEIGRAIVNFDGPIVFCVISRYHGGAFVVFSGALNDNMEVVAVEGSFASVLGGAPAAAVVFTRDVNARTAADPRVRELEAAVAAAPAADRGRLRVELADVRASVRSEKLGEVAGEFEAIHTIERAERVGSVDTTIAPESLRPYLIDAVERGMARAR